MNEQSLFHEFLSTYRQPFLCLKTEMLRLRITVQIRKKMSGQIEDYSSAEAVRKERIKEEKYVTFARI